MAVLENSLRELTDRIDSSLAPHQWTFIVGSYIRVLSIRQNKLETDVVEGTDVPLEDLYDLEDGRMCIEAEKLRQLLGNLGQDDLEAFLRDGYDLIHASSPYRQ